MQTAVKIVLYSNKRLQFVNVSVRPAYLYTQVVENNNTFCKRVGLRVKNTTLLLWRCCTGGSGMNPICCENSVKLTEKSHLE